MTTYFNKQSLANFVGKYWHILFLICLSLLPVVWFLGKGEAIINGVDTNFPLDPKMFFLRRFYMWNNLGNSGHDFSFAPAGIFFHLIQLIPYLLGLSLQNVEKISLIFWFGVIVLNSYLFSGNFLKQKLYRVLFVTLYALNIYMFNSWENIKVANLSLVAGIPLLLHIFVRLKNDLIGKSRAFGEIIFVSFILAGSGINPAYFITAIIILFVFTLSFCLLDKNIKKPSKTFLFIVMIILILSAYWVIPTISFILRNVTQGESISSIGFNNWLNSLSENTSIVNVLRGQGAWDWYAFDSLTKAPLFLPYTPNYFYRITFILFSFMVPSIALLALIFRNIDKNKYYLHFQY